MAVVVPAATVKLTRLRPFQITIKKSENEKGGRSCGEMKQAPETEVVFRAEVIWLPSLMVVPDSEKKHLEASDDSNCDQRKQVKMLKSIGKI